MGRTRERFIQDGIEKYLRYLKPYAPAELKVLREEKVEDLRDAPRIRKLEAAKITKTISPSAYVVALDERGREFTSHEFAAFMDKALENGIREMSFVLGGAMGLDESVTGKADTVLALSRWTLTHEMARLVLLEQLYRAFTIIKGRTYHY
ncbi:MAG: 23S rRNA (pseudouridine(1915)-N(3))-methyltransferase RlmH, partial [Nitrospirae bacterium]|nr:23S rRNA (pseudouridine(1915)-N(3))-methyltransferase RlmH [Nitrospirota bacterium]